MQVEATKVLENGGDLDIATGEEVSRRPTAVALGRVRQNGPQRISLTEPFPSGPQFAHSHASTILAKPVRPGRLGAGRNDPSPIIEVVRIQTATDHDRACIVIPTRDRPEDLRRCLGALDCQEHAPALEILVVDDGSVPPLREADFTSAHQLRVIRGPGAGPAAARNLGIAEASGDIVLFTDDDTLPGARWARTAVDYLRDHPDALGVEGPVWSAPFDPLYQYSIYTRGPGNYITCNVAYRADALRRVNGFDADAFPYAHGEDRDLGFRILSLGPIGYAGEMTVEHTPREITLHSFYRRALWGKSDIVLEARHPDHASWSNGVPARLRPVVSALQSAPRYLRPHAAPRTLSARRILRALLASMLTLSGAIVAAATQRDVSTPT